MAGPLSGFRILDLSAVLSGPLATMLLCDQGAEVIKVEPLAGDIVRQMGGGQADTSPSFLSANRGKKSIALDLKTPEGVQIVKNIAATADVFVQNFRPGAIERMGLDYEVLKQVKPDIVYCSISGFGEDGPYAHKRVYDPVIQALSGLADIQRHRDTGRPQMIRTVIPDKTTAITSAQAITAALLARERTGKGQHIKLAMLDAMIALTWAEGMAGYTVVGDECKPPPQLAPDLVYQTMDGYITAGAVSNAEWEGMCRSLDRESWLNDERFNTPNGRIKNVDERITMTGAVIATNTSEYWLKQLDDHGVPCAPVLSRKTLLDHEQILANQLIVELDDDSLGRVRQARPAAIFSETPAKIQGSAPGLGEHSRSILANCGFEDSDIDRLYQSNVVR